MAALALTPRASRSLALLLAAALLLAMAAVIAVPAWFLHSRYDEQLDRQRRSYRAYQRAVEGRPALEEKLDAVRAKDGRQFYLKAVGVPLATAEVQDRLNALINGNGGRIISTQVPTPKDDGRYKQIIVNLQFYANTPALRGILHAIESARPLLTIENLTVRSQVPFNFKGTPGVEPELYVMLDVAGYMSSEARPAEPKPAPPKAQTKS
jgi:type II secretory pathway pseudopilin PulG